VCLGKLGDVNRFIRKLPELFVIGDQ